MNNELDVREDDRGLIAGVIQAYLSGENTRSPDRDSNKPPPDPKVRSVTV
jgi:hypothetical protein